MARRNLNEITEKKDIELSGMLADQEGEIVLACKDTLFFLDDTLQINNKVSSKQGVFVDIALAKSGQFVCVTDQTDSAEISLKIILLDPQKKQWGEEIPIHLDDTTSDFVMDGVDYDFCYKAPSGIGGYHIGSKEKKIIVDYTDSYMINHDTEGMVDVGGNRFVGKTEHIVGSEKQITLVSYEKKDENSVTQ